MFISRAVILQMFFIVAMEAAPIRKSNAQSSSLCRDGEQDMCQICDSLDLEESGYRRCIESLAYQTSLSDQRSAAPWALGPVASQVLDKRAKYFLGKRVKYFLGKRGGTGRQLEDDETFLNPFQRGFGVEKHAKYFLGK